MNLRFLFAFLCLTLSAAACKSGDELEADLLGTRLQVQVIDTFTIKAATVLLDSIPTSATGTLLAGQYKDPYLGTVSARTFFRLELAQSFRIDAGVDVVYDSLVLVLPYNYWYGDTTRVNQLRVYPLAATYDPQATYYNTSSLDSMPQLLGSVSFRPRPRSIDTLRIRLSDALGNRLFTQVLGDGINTTDDWLGFLKGVVVVPVVGNNSAVMGFSPTATVLNLYYHRNTEVEPVKLIQSFKAGPNFNQLRSDRRLTSLARLRSLGDAISADSSGQQVFLQTGVGIATRLDFPTLQSIGTGKNVGINQAVLSLRPLPLSLSDIQPLPSALSLYTASESNRLKAKLPFSYQSVAQEIGYNIDPLSGETSYRLDLTSYTTSILRSSSSRYDGLLLVPTSLIGGVNRLVLSSRQGPQYGIRLTVYYTLIL